MFHLCSFWLIYENPIYNTNRFELQCEGGVTWRVSDCEELVFWRTLHIPLFGGFCNNMEFYLEELGQGSRII